MALDNRLLFDTSLTRKQLRDLIVALFGVGFEKGQDLFRFQVPGVTVVLLSAATTSRRLLAQFNVVPNMELFFRIDKFEGFDEGQRNMMTLVEEVIRKASNDCVFISVDQPLLVRKDHRFFLEASESEYWKKLLAALPAAVEEPFDLKELPPL